MNCRSYYHFALSLIITAAFLITTGCSARQNLLEAKSPGAKDIDLLWAEQRDKLNEPTSNFIFEMFRRNYGKTLCLPGNSRLLDVRRNVVNYLKARTNTNQASSLDVAISIWTLYPCPFSPYRSELKPATKDDIEGVWIFSGSSLPFRTAPLAKPVALFGANVSLVCEVLGLYSGGEMRHAMEGGPYECRFKKASDFDYTRKMPRISSWAMIDDGRIKVTRTDIKDHVEEWDFYSVKKDFTFRDIHFKTSDLVAYLRHEKGNDKNAATQFRHWRLLP